jgi:hypothetical protein
VGGDFREKLRAVLNLPIAAAENAYGIPLTGAPHGGYFKNTMTEAFKKYRGECVNCDFEDPRGICVTLLEENFPKLIKLMYRPKPEAPGIRARAKAVIPHLNAGTFDEDKHFSEQPVRLRTLFWISDVIINPDGIAPNSAARVEGEEVYFKKYQREKPDIKLVFTTIRQGGLRVVVTSFLEREEDLPKYCGLPLLWQPK